MGASLATLCSADAALRSLSRGAPAQVYGLFANEDELLVALADAVETEAQGELAGDADMEAALTVLARHRWLLTACLVNVMAPPEAIQLGEQRLLVPTSNPPDTDSSQRWARAVDHSSRAAMRRVFGHSITVGQRIDVDIDESRFDTRHAVSLVTVEEGSLSVARERAQGGSTILRSGLDAAVATAPRDVHANLAGGD